MHRTACSESEPVVASRAAPVHIHCVGQRSSHVLIWIILSLCNAIPALANDLRFQDQEVLTPSNGADGDHFGRSVALSKRFAFVGAPRVDQVATDVGRVYAYTHDGSDFGLTAEIRSPETSSMGRFGTSISADAGRVLIGAPGASGNDVATGAAYIFRREGADWTLEQKIVAPDGVQRDQFGFAVDMEGDVAVIGARHEDSAGSDAGAAYVFRFDGQSWLQEQKLTAGDRVPRAEFGNAVALDHSILVIGAYRDSSVENHAGAAYVFEHDGAGWVETQKLNGSGQRGAQFGNAVDVDGRRALVGAWKEDTYYRNSGAAYLFHHDGVSWQEEIRWTGGPGTLEAPAFSYEVGLDGVPVSQTAHYNVGALNHNTLVNVFFAQDQWQPRSNLTVNAGARLDNEKLLQSDGIELVDAWMFSPRLGISWDPRGDLQNLFSVNAGRYYDISALSLAAWGDTRSTNYLEVCPWDEEAGAYADDDRCLVQDPVAEPSVFTPDLSPYGIDKLVVGYQRALPNQISVGVKAIASRTFNLSDDVNLDDHYWEIRNPTVIKQRDYRALEFTAQRRWQDDWQLLASYTLSSSRGTNPGQIEGGSSGNDVGVYLDNPADPFIRLYYNWLGPLFGLNIYEGLGYDQYTAFGNTYPGSPEGFYGYLPYHSFHQVKVNGSYRSPWGTEFGLAYEFDSGHAWQADGFLLFYGNSTFPEGRGSRFMPAIHFVDINVGHTFYFLDGRSVELQANFFNVLDLEQPLSYFSNFNQQDDYLESIGVLEAGTSNPGFGEPFFRQGPRSLQASAKFTF